MCMIIFMEELIYQKFILGCQNLDDALLLFRNTKNNDELVETMLKRK